MVTKEVDSARLLLIADTHDTLLFFSSRGKVFSLKCYRIPHLDSSGRTAKGTSLTNLLPLDPKEQITTAVAANLARGNFLLLATARGKIKRIPAEKFAFLKSRGLISISLGNGDELVAAALAKEEEEVILVSEKGRSIRLAVDGFRASSRTSQGVIGMRLNPDDKLKSMEIIQPDAYLLTVTTNGFGKVSPISAYPVHRRAGKGIQTHRVGEKTGRVVAAKLTYPSEELILISAQGIIIRLLLKSVRIHSRNTRGISLTKLDSGNKVISIACLKVKKGD
jgi:DNA gyrase subunit A